MTGLPALAIDAIDIGFLGLERAAAAFVVRRRDGAGLGRPILVECGTATCQPQLLAGLVRLGIDPVSIDTLLVTHIHLDHAGGAGHWSSRPHAAAEVFVHPFGVRHLCDPAKLIASSRRVHGPSYERFYGDPLPCPPDRVHAVEDGGTFIRHGIRCTAIETPGHARHHHAWLLSGASDGEDKHAAATTLFTGDVASMMTPGSTHIAVPTPPPEFDLHAWRHSLDRLEAIKPDTLWLTHGCRVADPIEHLRSARRRLDDEVAFALALLDEVDRGLPEEEAVDRYQAWLWPRAAASGVTPERLRAYLGPRFFRMNLGGIRRWREQQGPTAPNPVL